MKKLMQLKLMQSKPIRLFASILLPFLISTILIVITQSVYLYKAFESLALKLIYDAQRTNLEIISYNVEMMRDTTRSLVTQAFFDSSINPLLYRDVDYTEYRSYIDSLYFYKNIYPFIDSIYIYNGSSIYMMPNSQFHSDADAFFDRDIMDILNDMEHNRSHSLIPRRIPMVNTLTGKVEADRYVDVYSYLFYQSQLRNGSIDEAIILNISADWIWQGHGAGIDSAFIIDGDGRLVSTMEGHTMLEDLSSAPFIQQVLLSKESVGHILANVDGEENFVTYIDLPDLNWKLVQLTPYSKVVESIHDLRSRTILFVVLLLILSIVILILLSRRLYVPITSLVQRSRRLESQQYVNASKLRQDYLRGILLHNDTGSIALLEEAFRTHSINLDPASPLLLILVTIDYYHKFRENYNLSDRTLFKYGISNILSELLQPIGNNICIDMGDNEIAVLLQYDGKKPSEDPALMEAINTTRQNVEAHLALSLSFIFGAPVPGLDALDYSEVQVLSHYCVLTGSKATIFAENVPGSQDRYIYPLDQEKILLDSLMLGRTNEMRQVLSEILCHVANHDPNQLNLTLIRLLTAASAMSDKLAKTNPNIQLSFDFNASLAQMQQLEYFEDIHAMFMNLFDVMATEIEHTKDHRYADLMNEVLHIIDRSYQDPGLSLEWIAEQVHLSPSYLSKIFRKQQNVSITSYINTARLEKACELLENTSMPICDIMQELGFLSQSNFFTLFKKSYGVTPNQYRQSRKGRNQNA